MGRKKKYESPAKLKKAVQAYFNSISYQRPVIVSTPTGSVDEKGQLEYSARLLTINEDGTLDMSGTGKPKTIIEYLETPSLSKLCVFLDISRETWSKYSADEKLSPVTEWAKMIVEGYWNDKLSESGKSERGARFALSAGFGWNRNGSWNEKHDIRLNGQKEDGTNNLLDTLSRIGEVNTDDLPEVE